MTVPQAAPPARIAFAEELRGIAALLVAVSHLAGVYWFDPAAVAAITFAPPLVAAPPTVAQVLAALPVNPGPLGVCVFFLISGFVVPFSFRRHGTLSFLGARLLRIYPTYLAAFAIALLARYLSARLWGAPFEISWGRAVANALLINNALGVQSFDLVNWTLQVELKFYLLYALLRHPIERRGVAIVLGFAALTLAFTAALHLVAPHLPARLFFMAEILATEASFTILILIGTLFHLHRRRLLGLPGLAGGIAAALALFLVARAINAPADESMAAITGPPVLALAVFGGLYGLRRAGVSFPPLRMLADVSYPLYAVHVALGYVLLRGLMGLAGLGYGPALAVTAAALALTSWGLHRLVERPSIAWGRALGGRRAS